MTAQEFFFFFETGFFCSFGACPGTNSSRPGWPWSHRDPLASASWVLGLKACATTARLAKNIIISTSQIQWIACSRSEKSKMCPKTGNSGSRIYFLFLLSSMCVWVFCLHVHLCATCVQCQEGKERVLDPLELLLSAHVGRGTQLGSSPRAKGALNHWAISPASYFTFVL